MFFKIMKYPGDIEVLKQKCLECSKSYLEHRVKDLFTDTYSTLLNEQGRHLDRMPEFEEVKNFFMDAAENYITQLGVPKERLRITQTWINVYPPGAHINAHAHKTFGEEIFSILLCLQGESGCATLVVGEDKFDIEEGEALIFQSGISHYGSPNTSKNDRIIITCDIIYSDITDEEFDRIMKVADRKFRTFR